MRELAFNVQPNHPIGLLINYVRALEIEETAVPQKALNYINDWYKSSSKVQLLIVNSTRGVAIVLFQPNVLACAAIRLACLDLKISLPLDPPWYLIFDVFQEEDLLKCQEAILQVYNISFDRALPMVPFELKIFQETFNCNSQRNHNYHRNRTNRDVYKSE